MPYLLLIGAFLTHAMTCRKRELTLDHIHTFLTRQGHGGPPRMSDKLNAVTTFKTTRTLKKHTPFTNIFILRRRIWKHDYVGQMIFGDLVGLKVPYICLTGGKTPKKPHPGTCPDRGSNPGPLRDKRACYRLFRRGFSGGQGPPPPVRSYDNYKI